MVDHENLRRDTKVACAYSDGEIKLKDIAEYLGMAEHSFYNYLAGYYEISDKNARKLRDIIADWLE